MRFLSTLLLATSLVTALDYPSGETPCGAREYNAEIDGNFESSIAHMKTRSAFLSYPVTIDVVFHVIHRSGDGNVPDKYLDAQIDLLNSDFAKTGLFQFKKIATTRTEGARYWASRGTSLYPESAKQYQMKSELRQGDSSTLNIYITLLDLNLMGYATFPQDYSSNPLDDGVVLNFITLPGMNIYEGKIGRTATHEIGHWLGLYHVFQGGCNFHNDFVADTKPTRKPSWGCPAPESAQCVIDDFERVDKFSWSLVTHMNDTSNNVMNYSHDLCRHSFTPGQVKRMKMTWQYLRNTKIVKKGGNNEFKGYQLHSYKFE